MTHEDQHTDLLDFPGAAALERAGRTEPLDPAVQARAHSLVLGAIAADAADTQETVRAEVVKPRFGRNRMFALAAAVAAIAVGAAILPVTDIGGDGPAASASASEVFTSMANHFSIADRVNSESISEHLKGESATAPYWKTKVRTWVEGDKAHTDTVYLSRNKVFIRTQSGRTITKSNPSGTSWSVGNTEVKWDDLDDLPTQPDALRRALSAGAPGSADEQTVQQAGSLLTEAPVSPRLRSALFRVLAGTSGAVVKEGVKDGAGRTGTQISWKWTEKLPVHSDHNPNWIVRPSDGQILELNQTRGKQDGHISQRATYLQTGPAKNTN
ncbi:hypothetical protein [Streptomyces sp. NPDC057509]|uniref:hypothetical protein n=1 Tax=Streptomyces sp. NPDC057509 TaxID=3346152 RepID=UPI00368198BE